MKKIKHYFLIFAFAASPLACERMLETDFSEEKPLIVMNGIVQPHEPIRIQIGKSYLFSDTTAMRAHLPHAKVELYINGKFEEEMKPTQKSEERTYGALYFTATTQAKSGDKIRFEASAPGMQTAWSEIEIPTPPAIEKINTASSIEKATQNNQNSWIQNTHHLYYDIPKDIAIEPFHRTMNLRIGLRKERTEREQYFMLNVYTSETPYHPDSLYKPLPLPVNTQKDPVFVNDPKNSVMDILFERNTKYSNSSVFTDKLFKNNAYTLDVSVSNYYRTKIERQETTDKNGHKTYIYKSHKVYNPPLKISVVALSPDLYYSLKSKQSRLYDNPLHFISEPQITFTNVNNGIGIVGAMSSVEKQIPIPPYPGGEKTIPM